MSPTGTQEKYRSPSLATVLHRANMRIALIAMALVGVSIFLAGLIALRAYTIENLGLSARNIAYTVEAAVVFNDREAASEALSSMTASHRFAAVLTYLTGMAMSCPTGRKPHREAGQVWKDCWRI